MTHSIRCLVLLFVLVCVAVPAFAQFTGPNFSARPAPPDISGQWRRLTDHEDARERGPGPEIGEYWGVPLNDAARMAADTYSASWLSTSQELQCRPHPVGYEPVSPLSIHIWIDLNPVTREPHAYRIQSYINGDRLVYLDGRPRPSDIAFHTWEGFSTGKWDGDTLTITTTHMKESFIRRNGIPASFRRTVTEHVSLDEPYLTWVVIVNDPDYLTEPFIRSGTFVRAPNEKVGNYPCAPQPEDYVPGRRTDFVPHYLPGANPALTEQAFKFKVPVEGTRGGAETLYPEYAEKLKTMSAPTAQYQLKPEYKDGSTRIAELASARPEPPPDYARAQVRVAHVQGSIYLLEGAGGNIALSAGPDGVIMVDTGVAQMSEKVLAAIHQLSQQFRPPAPESGASRYASPWMVEHSLPPTTIRAIINTSIDPDHMGGNANIAFSPLFRPAGTEGGDQSMSEIIVGYDIILQRLLALDGTPNAVPTRAMPTNTYFAQKYRFHRYLNGDGIEVIHAPNAYTDGDSLVYFRNSNVIVTGDIFNGDTYPVIDVEKGGNVQGIIDALIRISDIGQPDEYWQGGTMIIPGHGRICDLADIGYYRDMVIVVRDRIQDMINKGMTLEQVRAAQPTMDFDPLFGRKSGATAKFVEGVYRSLKRP